MGRGGGDQCCAAFCLCGPVLPCVRLIVPSVGVGGPSACILCWMMLEGVFCCLLMEALFLTCCTSCSPWEARGGVDAIGGWCCVTW